MSRSQELGSLTPKIIIVWNSLQRGLKKCLYLWRNIQKTVILLLITHEAPRSHWPAHGSLAVGSSLWKAIPHFVYPFMSIDIWVVSPFWLLWIALFRSTGLSSKSLLKSWAGSPNQLPLIFYWLPLTAREIGGYICHPQKYISQVKGEREKILGKQLADHTVLLKGLSLINIPLTLR